MTSLSKCYLLINLLLVVGFIVFRVARFVIAKLRLKPSYQSLTRSAQIIMLASLFIPLILALVPEKKMPRLKFEAVRPAVEALTKSHLQAIGSKRHAPIPLDAQADRLNGFSLRTVLTYIDTALTQPARLTCLILLLIGVLAMLTRLTKNVSQLQTMLSEGMVIRRLRKTIVLVSDAVSIPFSTLVGFKAYTVIPTGLLNDSKDVRLAIRHEFQHHRQFDTAWALLIEFWVCLFYANPIIYLWKKEITELQEFSCDEALIGQRGVPSHDYGSCLIRVAEAALGKRQMLVGTACMAAATKNPRYLKSFLRRRIEMFNVHESSRRAKSVAVLVGALSVIVTGAVAFGAQQVLRSSSKNLPNAGTALFDANVQSIAEEVLTKAVRDFKAKAGFVLVSDPETGRLLAAANVSTVPTTGGKAWSLAYQLEPASVMKGLTAASAVEDGLTTFEDSFDCENGSYMYGHNLLHDWKAFDHLSTADTVVHSSNICGVKIAARLGSEGLAKSIHNFGFGVGGTTQGFPQAIAGDVPTTDQLSEEEYVALIGTGYTLQGEFSVTPLEMVQAYGAIANGGKLMKPLRANDPDSAATVVRRVLSESTAQGMKSVLQRVVQDGTGRPAQSQVYTTAGKTGTAYTPGAPGHRTLGGERSIASFAGFAPVENPRLAVYVGIIEPTNRKNRQPMGSEHAAPVFREVIERVLQQQGVAPDKK